jgi:hypothetical protein
MGSSFKSSSERLGEYGNRQSQWPMMPSGSAQAIASEMKRAKAYDESYKDMSNEKIEAVAQKLKDFNDDKKAQIEGLLKKDIDSWNINDAKESLRLSDDLAQKWEGLRTANPNDNTVLFHLSMNDKMITNKDFSDFERAERQYQQGKIFVGYGGRNDPKWVATLNEVHRIDGVFREKLKSIKTLINNYTG